MKLIKIITILILLLVGSPLVYAQGQTFNHQKEAIYNFQSKIVVDTDGNATVTETIIILAQGNKIKRGIFRDIPNTAAEPVQISTLYMDGHPHSYFTEKQHNNLRVNFGGDNFLTPGHHTYVLKYQINNVVRFFKDYDELYWNVTGNGWAFPIYSASFDVQLPIGANIMPSRSSSYTGLSGKKEANSRQISKTNFVTTAPLEPGQGITVAVAWQKGIVVDKGPKLPPTAMLLLPIIFILFMMSYYIITWLKCGNDPDDSSIVLYTPPQGISAAFTQFFSYNRFDNNTLTIAFLSLALKGAISIEQYPGSTILNNKNQNTLNLTQDEDYLYKEIFKSSDTFTISHAYYRQIADIFKNFNKYLSVMVKPYKTQNHKLLILPAILLLVWQAVFLPHIPIIFINVHYSIFLLAFVASPRNKFFKVLMGIAITLFYSVFFTSLVTDLQNPFLVLAQIAFLLGLWGFIIYFYIIDMVTPQGRQLRQELNGFRKYMTVAEAQRAALSNPDDTGRIFCDYLPYAFSFGIENKWIEAFESKLSATQMERLISDVGGIKALRNGMLKSAIVSAMPKSNGHSSGSGGGGFSGGGSGGGGGGGR